ncbi:hypothetical protein IPA_06805 [Ignicoccus pacificus DSM 13166]|uniref:Uncharacterized protein n=1 Tax=Ignicoccus pacificus DSM 13166 TaxID=940294 RepID=A0A977KBI7_9CREN|nr:hypothetical protein IPA_06805 [Ignicoccus pacificus DSM 13166]
MRIRVESDEIRASLELDQVNVIYGPPSSGKTTLLKTLYLALSMKYSGCLKHRTTAILLSHLVEGIKHDKCEQGQLIKCEFEVPIDLIKNAVDSTLASLFSLLQVPPANVFIEDENPLDLSKRIKELCNLRVRVGTFSFITMRCEGNSVKGTWAWDQSEEIPFPPDIIAETLLPSSEVEVTYLPSGRSDLVKLRKVEGPLHLSCFSDTYEAEGSSFEVERDVLKQSLKHDWILIENFWGDKYSLDLLKEFLRQVLEKGANVVIETRDERVVEAVRGVGRILELPFK